MAMSLTLLVMNWFVMRAGITIAPMPLQAFFKLLFMGGLLKAVWFFRHCHDANIASNLELQN